MNLLDYECDGNEHPYLVRLMSAYQSVNTSIPSRQELLETQYDMPQVDGHCSLKALAADAGFNSDDYLKQLREASECMGRAMYNPEGN